MGNNSHRFADSFGQCLCKAANTSSWLPNTTRSWWNWKREFILCCNCMQRGTSRMWLSLRYVVWQSVTRDSSAKCHLVLERCTKLQKYWLRVKLEPGKWFIGIVFVEKTRSCTGMNMKCRGFKCCLFLERRFEEWEAIWACYLHFLAIFQNSLCQLAREKSRILDVGWWAKMRMVFEASIAGERNLHSLSHTDTSHWLSVLWLKALLLWFLRKATQHFSISTAGSKSWITKGMNLPLFIILSAVLA